eukprot:gb/GFBE01042853.1/.p1 GENE.gb/GFBE01042853.1/~~gb/GFBE01042853.1/.p1  ORF type:complete len:315 (+),score=40.98 gb/GFBE01042853.1/:1-945(+)
MLFAPQPFLVLCVPTGQVSQSPFCGPGPQYQHAAQQSSDSPQVSHLCFPKDTADDQVKEDNFNWSTPEPSPRMWAGSSPPSPWSAASDNSQSPGGTRTSLSPNAPIFVPLRLACTGTGDSSLESLASGHASPTLRRGTQQCKTVMETQATATKQAPTQQASRSPVPRDIPEGFATLVIRNIPARYTQEMLLAEFGADGSFNFLWLPYSFRDSRTMGYAFINFRSHKLAVQFQEKWHRCFLQDHGRTKHLDVAAATVQGLAENLRQFNEKSIARLAKVDMLPIFLGRAGERLDAITELQRFRVIPAVASAPRVRV